MKEAMWGVGFIFLAIFGFFLISLFGNITVTNQQDYTAMKNTVEAAMYDSIDYARYKTGFCLCTNKDKTKVNGIEKVVFTDSSEYELFDLEDGVCPNTNYASCELLEGEYRIDKKVFAESIVRRFAESVKGNYDYQLVIGDIIEYPPKANITIKSSNTSELDNEEYTIVNEISSILEVDGVVHTDITPTEEKNYKITVMHYYGGTHYKKYDVIMEGLKSGKDYKTTKNNKEGFYFVYAKDSKNNAYTDDATITIDNSDVTVRYYYNKIQQGQNPPGGSGNGIDPPVSGCFLPGTKVMVKNGYQDIDKLKVGDYVLTYNEEKDINEYKKITYVFEFKDIDEVLYTITTGDMEFSLTGHHRVYTNRNNEYVYVATQDLKVGDIVKYSNGETKKITGITNKPIKQTVYNLEIEDNDNFYIGTEGILVHHAVAEKTLGDITIDVNAFK